MVSEVGRRPYFKPDNVRIPATCERLSASVPPGAPPPPDDVLEALVDALEAAASTSTASAPSAAFATSAVSAASSASASQANLNSWSLMLPFGIAECIVSYLIDDFSLPYYHPGNQCFLPPMERR